jgi:hypothetical protein
LRVGLGSRSEEAEKQRSKETSKQKSKEKQKSKSKEAGIQEKKKLKTISPQTNSPPFIA